MTHPEPVEGRDLLAGLNSAQREAVEHVDGPLLIVAGPGSGKTRVITHRIAYLVQVCGVTPYGILAMTFTNKAAREMRDRLNRLVGPHSDALTVGTFHSFCARLLRRDGERVGLPRNYSIFDDDDQMAAIRHCLEEADYDPKRYPPRAVLATISRAKSVLWDSQAMAQHAAGDYFEEVCARVYRHYEELLARNGAADFDDLLLRTAQLFREFPEVLQAYQHRYNYLMVDEFQDTNIAQYRISQMLARSHQNFCVVGDPDQSIYSWRSADVRNILNFKSDNPRARVISLGQNYRSTSNILNAAKGLISSNGQRLDNDLFTENTVGIPVQVYEAYDEEEESNRTIAEIKRLIREEDFKPADCAVMYRFNAQSRALERACTEQQVKYRLVGGTQLYRRREVQDLIAHLRLLFNQRDDVNLARVAKVPPKDIGPQTLKKLSDWASVRQTSVFGAMREVAAAKAANGPSPVPLAARAVNSITRFVEVIDRLIALSEEAPVTELINVLMVESGLERHIEEKYDRPEERLDSIMDFRSIAEDFDGEVPPEGLASLLERAALVSQVDELVDAEEFITLITLHQAKGLEFPVVFIVGMEEGMLPWNREDTLDRDSGESDDLQEERRLCYVGMTRARERLYLLRAFRRSFMGESRIRHESRFLREIPVELLASADLGPSRAVSPPTPGRGGSIRPAMLANAAAAPPPSGPSLRVGDLVHHRAFGEGIITGYNPSSSDDEVTVEFAGGVGVKRLLLSLAPLEKLDD